MEVELKDGDLIHHADLEIMPAKGDLLVINSYSDPKSATNGNYRVKEVVHNLCHGISGIRSSLACPTLIIEHED